MRGKTTGLERLGGFVWEISLDSWVFLLKKVPKGTRCLWLAWLRVYLAEMCWGITVSLIQPSSHPISSPQSVSLAPCSVKNQISKKKPLSALGDRSGPSWLWRPLLVFFSLYLLPLWYPRGAHCCMGSRGERVSAPREESQHSLSCSPEY